MTKSIHRAARRYHNGMAANTLADQYIIELERPSERDGSLTPIRAMATNRADETKTSEAWWSFARTRANLISIMGATQEDAEWYLQQLEDHRYASLEHHVPGVRPGPATFKGHELIALGFLDPLHPSL